MTGKPHVRLLSLVLLLLLPGLVSAKDEEEPKKEKPVKLAVILYGTEYEVVPMTELKAHRKRAAEAHKEALKAHKAAKKAAKKAKEKFTEPKPKKPVYKLLGKGLDSEDEAKALIARILEEKRKREERRAKRKK